MDQLHLDAEFIISARFEKKILIKRFPKHFLIIGFFYPLNRNPLFYCALKCCSTLNYKEYPVGANQNRFFAILRYVLFKFNQNSSSSIYQSEVKFIGTFYSDSLVGAFDGFLCMTRKIDETQFRIISDRWPDFTSSAVTISLLLSLHNKT